MGLGLGMLVAGQLAISIMGNTFVNGAGQPIRLLGVDRPGTEYACQQGWGYSNGAEDQADADAIAAWHVNAVRIPLNEDCWLGINSEGFYGSALGYQQSIETYVQDLNADGIYAILDLHWSAPGTVVADEQRPMPDSHSATFWTSVASAFKNNPAVVFDVFNEPYSPAADFPDDSPSYPVSWSCWRNGGCQVPVTADGADPGNNPQTYTAVGMQTLVNAIRSTGATQPIMVGGLSYSNDLSGWLANEPTDPDNQLAASVHVYEGENCSSDDCWNAQVAPVAAQVPVVAGEFGGNSCPSSDGAAFDNDFMGWADTNNVSYLGWGWLEGVTPDCNDYYLIDQDGNPASPNGTALHDHLAALAAGPPATTTSTTPTTSTPNTTPTTSTSSTTPPTTTSTPVTTTAPATTAPKSTSTTATTAVHKVKKPACVVPKLHGFTLTRAHRKLAAAHCRLGKVHRPRC